MKVKYIIGIDPDLHKSGFSVYDSEQKKLILCTSLFLWDLFENIDTFTNDMSLFRLEYPKNTNTYHAGGKGAALNVGKNQAVAIIIAEYLDTKNANYQKLDPAGFSTIFKDVKYFKTVTKYDGVTNQDARASAAMVFGR